MLQIVDDHILASRIRRKHCLGCLGHPLPFLEYWAPTRQVVLHAQHALSLEEHGEWVWVYIYEPMSMSSGSLSMWVCNAPLHRGQKRKIEKIALRYVCAGTGLKQAQRQRHDIHEYSLNYMIGLCHYVPLLAIPSSALPRAGHASEFPKDLLVDWTFQTEHRTAGQTWLKRCWPESSKTCRFAVILILFMSMFLLSSLILFVLHLFVNIKDLTSCLANGRRDAQVESLERSKTVLTFCEKCPCFQAKRKKVKSRKVDFSTFGQKFRYFQVMTGSGWGGLRGLTH